MIIDFGNNNKWVCDTYALAYKLSFYVSDVERHNILKGLRNGSIDIIKFIVEHNIGWHQIMCYCRPSYMHEYNTQRLQPLWRAEHSNHISTQEFHKVLTKNV